ncbi:uncharacterized protein BDZ83DRAFT_646798 [Colletotrichum acutatum]|uniref:Uncharacterized protein n=1 Tax=Glomerella acutata TaxID=27357 RepID=A0AAD8XP90_GLOAC|nr:uncharacterized protein BDZ83DRAFT_646798 [Colletotrichum acutatum]KAK1730923.1 hypothetical protein BDZ83DRAFT_646798 [Colletotrichum acutatum]
MTLVKLTYGHLEADILTHRGQSETCRCRSSSNLVAFGSYRGSDHIEPELTETLLPILIVILILVLVLRIVLTELGHLEVGSGSVSGAEGGWVPSSNVVGVGVGAGAGVDAGVRALVARNHCQSRLFWETHESEYDASQCLSCPR